jgi:Rrf2 family transcriptional regulator, nitric oxide-sensitive transcriptional repressor
MFSQTFEYALRAIVYLASRQEACSTQQIAAATRTPPAYLAKVLQNLGRHDLVRSQRGLYGGFALGKSASELTIWEIVQAVEPITRLRECPLELKAHRFQLCPLHKKIDDALAELERAFREATIADILAAPTNAKPPCLFPYHDKEASGGRIPLKQFS